HHAAHGHRLCAAAPLLGPDGARPRHRAARPARARRAAAARRLDEAHPGHGGDGQPRRLRARDRAARTRARDRAPGRHRRAGGDRHPAVGGGRGRDRAHRADVGDLHSRARLDDPALAGVVMELIDNLATGLSVALTPANLLFALIGALVGTLIGVLPGIGPIATIAMLLPLTFRLEPVSGLIMLAGIFYGAQYGGSTTALLVNPPGETSSVVACIDGHQMARQGKAGSALAIAALGSFFAGTVATFIIAMFAPPLARVGQSFGAPEYFSLMVLGLVAAVVLAHGSLL